MLRGPATSRAVPVVCIRVASSRWPLFGRTRTLNAATYCALVSSIPAGQQRNGQAAGARDTVLRIRWSCLSCAR